MRVTVCELPDERTLFVSEWDKLVSHVQANQSDLVVLNEMPFSKWFGTTPHFDREVWQTVVTEHQNWLPRLKELAPATVVASCPVNQATKRLNQGFMWSSELGYQALHTKYYLPDEEGVWEASWYQPGDGSFELVNTDVGKLGFLICSELWAMSRAQAYGKAGVHLLVTPRATGQTSLEKWLVGGRTAAIIAGAFALSSNRVSGSDFGGQGWVVSPDGEVLGITTPDQPFITVDIDINEAERAKHTYPRYILE